MPYKDPAKQRAFQRQHVAQRRQEFLAGQICVDCGARDRLEIDHRDPEQKTSHRIWSWSRERILDELAKCDIRCGPCHRARHAAERRREHGAAGYKRGCRCETCLAWKRQSYRPRPESNGRERLCRPLRNHSATGPPAEPIQLSLWEAA